MDQAPARLTAYDRGAGRRIIPGRRSHALRGEQGTDDVVYLPIRHGVSVFAMRKNLDIPPDPWDVPRFRLAHMTPSQ